MIDLNPLERFCYIVAKIFYLVNKINSISYSEAGDKMHTTYQNRKIVRSLKQRLYQLIICRLDGEKTADTEYRQNIFNLIAKGIGGFILFGGEREEIRKFIRETQSMSEIPLFLSSDIERGVGQQVKGCTHFPCQMAVASAIDKNNPEDISVLTEALRELALEAIDIGINMPLIPVLDVNRNPDNPIICTRAFSDDPEQVALFGKLYIRNLQDSGLLCCGKHFPGHGDTSLDSHIQLPVIDKAYGDLMNTDIVPFEHAVKEGVSSIMAGHLTIPALDDKPASLSEKVIGKLLREELGFHGLVLTDALNMHALRGTEKVSVQCIKAGADILLHPDDADFTVQELMHAIESGELSEAQIDSAITRILQAKGKLIKKDEGAFYSNNTLQSLSLQITGKSIAQVRNKAGLLPISDPENIHVVLAGDDRYFEHSAFRKFFHNVSTLADNLAPDNKTVIFPVFTSVAAWKGSSGIGEIEKNRINQIIGTARNSIVISFGSPYILRHFKGADILIAAYEGTAQAEEAVIRCLEGQAAFRGKLPVKLNL
jgi:beta-N-acetylhexosaminidase